MVRTAGGGIPSQLSDMAALCDALRERCTAEEGWLVDEGGTGGKNQIGLPQLQLVFS